MALRGTLKDFGIADIFQLIGHQGKSGTLAVRNREQHVLIYFVDGNVVRAESATRNERDLLGTMLVRAQVITEAQLAEALDTQKRTLVRLGQILIDSGLLTPEVLQTFTRLQTTETIYRLFLWDNGTYEFKQEQVAQEPGSDLIRSENVLMEGFRQVDEWPMIRRKITGYGFTFYKLEDLDELITEAAGADPAGGDDELGFGGLDDAFGEFDADDSSSHNPRLRSIGNNERLVYGLISHDRDVQKIIDLSRLGEFETCKALVNLIDAKIIEPLPEGAQRRPSGAATVGGITTVRHPPWIRVAMRVGLVVASLVGAMAGISELGIEPQDLFTPHHATGYVEQGVERLLARGRLQRIVHALRVYHAQQGSYPAHLDVLAKEGYLAPADLVFPWQHPYAYRADGDTYQLARPLF